MNNEKIKHLKFKMLLFLGLGILGFVLTNYLFGLHKDIIMLQNDEIFSKEIEPLDHYSHEVEDGNVDAGYIYSEEDQSIIEEQSDLLTPAYNTKFIGIIVSCIFLIFSLITYERYYKEKKRDFYS